MRRFAFYFSTFLLTFSISVFAFCAIAAVSFSSPKIQEVHITSDEVIPMSLPEITVEIDEEANGAFKVLQPTIQKWLKGERIESGEWVTVDLKLIEHITGKDASELTEEELKFWTLSHFDFEPTLIDVNGDGKKELAIRNLCAAVGNCNFQIFQKHGDGYRNLLDSTNRGAQRFKLRKTRSGGYFDLETMIHADYASGEMYVYRFRGDKYELRDCMNYSYLARDKDWNQYQVKEPILRKWKCEE